MSAKCGMPSEARLERTTFTVDRRGLANSPLGAVEIYLDRRGLVDFTLGAVEIHLDRRGLAFS